MNSERSDRFTRIMNQAIGLQEFWTKRQAYNNSEASDKFTRILN